MFYSRFCYSFSELNNNFVQLNPINDWSLYLNQPLNYIKIGKARIISGVIVANKSQAANTPIAILPETCDIARFKVTTNSNSILAANIVNNSVNIESEVPINTIIYVSAITLVV